MLATIQAVKRPPATARASTTTAAISQPATLFDDLRGPLDGVPEPAGGGAPAPGSVKSVDTRPE